VASQDDASDTDGEVDGTFGCVDYAVVAGDGVGAHQEEEVWEAGHTAPCGLLAWGRGRGGGGGPR